MTISRRQFIQGAAGAAVVASGASGAVARLPTRALGKTGIEVSILGFGSGSRFLMYKDEDKALAALSRALDLGITYIDTAHSYGDGKSEERIGKLMPERRKGITLATKLSARTADDACAPPDRDQPQAAADRPARHPPHPRARRPGRSGRHREARRHPEGHV